MTEKRYSQFIRRRDSRSPGAIAELVDRAGFEQTLRNDSLIITIPGATVRTIDDRLDQIGFPGPRIEPGLVSSGFDASKFFARVDHRLNSNYQLTARYGLYDISAINSRTVGGLNAVSRGTNLDNRDHTNISGVASFGTATFSPMARDIDLYEIVNNFTTQRGSHSIKAGVDFLY
jgi:hypothetical protein